MSRQGTFYPAKGTINPAATPSFMSRQGTYYPAKGTFNPAATPSFMSRVHSSTVVVQKVMDAYESI
mgnify:CR=1 FL=1